MTKAPDSMLYGLCDTRGCRSFTNSSLHKEPPIWPKDFKHWFICQKDYSTDLLSSLWVPWPTGDFWHCFAPLTLFSWQQFCHIGQLQSSHSGYWHFFSQYWFCCTIMFGAVSLLSRKLVTDLSVFCIGKTGSI